MFVPTMQLLLFVLILQLLPVLLLTPIVPVLPIFPFALLLQPTLGPVTIAVPPSASIWVAFELGLAIEFVTAILLIMLLPLLLLLLLLALSTPAISVLSTVFVECVTATVVALRFMFATTMLCED